VSGALAADRYGPSVPTPADTTFTRRQFMIYELVMDGCEHDQAAREVDETLARDGGPGPDEQLSWAQWDAEADRSSLRS
jgi:hypothetical protein